VIGTVTLTVGQLYTIKYLAQNDVGFSPDSVFTFVALARSAETPVAPIFD
jgi:hypothetical protein